MRLYVYMNFSKHWNWTCPNIYDRVFINPYEKPLLTAVLYKGNLYSQRYYPIVKKLVPDLKDGNVTWKE